MRQVQLTPSVWLCAVGNDSGIVSHNAASVTKQVMQKCLPLSVRLCAVGNDSGIVAHNAAGVILLFVHVVYHIFLGILQQKYILYSTVKKTKEVLLTNVHCTRKVSSF